MTLKPAWGWKLLSVVAALSVPHTLVAHSPSDPGGIVLYTEDTSAADPSTLPRYTRYQVDREDGFLRLVLASYPGPSWVLDGFLPLRRFEWLSITGVPGVLLAELFRSFRYPPVLVADEGRFSASGSFGDRRVDFRSLGVYRNTTGLVPLGDYFERVGRWWRRRWSLVPCSRWVELEGRSDFRPLERVRRASEYAPQQDAYRHPPIDD